MTTQLSRWTRRMVLVGCALALPLGASAETAPKVKFQTSQGDFIVEVYKDFMIQGGGFTTDFKQKTTRAPIPLEATNGLKNDVGTIAMARTGNPNSATSQFYINVVKNDMLNAPNPDGHGYTVFGKITSGMDVVNKIRDIPTGPNGPFPSDVPRTPIVINSATLVK